jgi:hypothetical protein
MSTMTEAAVMKMKKSPILQLLQSQMTRVHLVLPVVIHLLAATAPLIQAQNPVVAAVRMKEERLTQSSRDRRCP